jgi:hypothetical protein
MKDFFKIFCYPDNHLLSFHRACTFIPTRDLKRIGIETFADPPDLPPITHSPMPQDSIIYMSDGTVIIIDR